MKMRVIKKYETELKEVGREHCEDETERRNGSPYV